MSDLDYWIRTRLIWTYFKRPYCWLFGHDTQELMGRVTHRDRWRRKMRYTHYCPRCLKFWKRERRWVAKENLPSPRNSD